MLRQEATRLFLGPGGVTEGLVAVLPFLGLNPAWLA